MRKLKIIILFTILTLGCTEEINFTSLAPPVNPFAGDYIVNLTGDLEGVATIPIRENGRVNNGIPVIFFSLLKVNLYIDGFISDEGTIDANLYCNRNFISPSGTISITSSEGSFTGSFSSGSGNYSISIINDRKYSGSWTSIKN